MDCLITWGAAATDGGCRLVAAATVWRVAGRFPLVGRAVVRLCSLALVARVLFAACALAWLAAYADVRSRVAYMAGWCHDAGYAFAPTQLDHAEAGGVILSDAGASFADAVRSHGDPDVLAMSDLLLIVNTADMMCGPDGVQVSFDERLADVEARYGAGSRQAVDVGAMLSVLRRELELRGVSVEAAERAGVERVDTEGESRRVG